MALVKSETTLPAPAMPLVLAIRNTNSDLVKPRTRHDRLSEWLDTTHQDLQAAYEKLQAASPVVLSTDYDMVLVEFTQALEKFKIARRQLIRLEDEQKKKAMDGLVIGLAETFVDDQMEDVV